MKDEDNRNPLSRKNASGEMWMGWFTESHQKMINKEGTLKIVTVLCGNYLNKDRIQESQPSRNVYFLRGKKRTGVVVELKKIMFMTFFR